MKIYLVLIFLISITVHSGERTRIYEVKEGVPIYKGYLELQQDGSKRVYSTTGIYKGKIQNNRLYDTSGKWVRQLRLYNED